MKDIDSSPSLSAEGNDSRSIAQVVHESVRAYKQALGEQTIPAWVDAPQWMRKSTLNAVRSRRDDPEAPPRAQHEARMAQKEANGWCFGPTRDLGNKTHPMMVPYEQLPTTERYKDALIQAVVDVLSYPID